MRPWELLRYTWADVMKMILGLQQRDEGLRRAAYIIHCSLVEKKHRAEINKVWPMPFDDKDNPVRSTLLERQLQLREQRKQLEQKTNHA